MSDTANAAAKNRRVRQEALRDQLSAMGLVQHVIDTAEKLNDETIEIDQLMVSRYKIVIDTKLKLIAKYLPDLKQTELVGNPDSPLEFKSPRISDEQLAAIIANTSGN